MEVKPKAKRNRNPISCSVCRKRKVKCDKQKPFCGSCIRHQMTDSCTYAQKTDQRQVGQDNNKSHKLVYEHPNVPVPKRAKRASSIRIKDMNNIVKDAQMGRDLKSYVNGEVNGKEMGELEEANQEEEEEEEEEEEDGGDSPMIGEIQYLKNKIRQIENSINSATTATASSASGGADFPKLPLPPLQAQLSFDKHLPLPAFSSIPSQSPINIPSQSPINLPPQTPLNLSQQTQINLLSMQQSPMGLPLPYNTKTYYPSTQSPPNNQTPIVLPGYNFLRVTPSTSDLQGSKPNPLLTPETKDIDLLLQHLKIAPNQQITFYDDIPPMIYRHSRVHNYGPLALIGTILREKYSKPIRDQVMKFKKNNLLSAKGSNFKDVWHGALGLDDVEPLKTEKMKSIPSAPDTKSTPKLIDDIVKILPNKRAMWLFVERFFKYSYPFVPYLDQTSFVKEIERLTNSNSLNDIQSEDPIKTLNISKKLDIAFIGSLIIVLNFASRSLLQNSDKPSENSKPETELYLLQKQMPTCSILIAQTCLDQFKLMGRCALPIFQCALLMTEFHKVDYYDGFADSGTQIFATLLIQTGISIGLNRDPSNFNPLVGNSPLGNLWRKIWYGLVFNDYYYYIQSGSSRGIKEESFDTKLPTFSPDTSNILDLDLEKKVIETMKVRYEIQSLSLELIEPACNTKKAPTIEFLLSKAFKLEEFLSFEFGSLRDWILKKHDNIHVNQIEKIIYTIEYINTMSVLEPILYQIITFLEKQENVVGSKFVLFKLLSNMMYIMANFNELICQSETYFGAGFDMFITPILQIAIHKAWFLLIVLSIKALIARKSFEEMEQTPEIETKLKALCVFRDSLLDATDKYYICTLSVLSSKYFYAWRLLKAHKFILKLLKEKQYLFNDQIKCFNFVRKMSIDELSSLNELIKVGNFCAKSQRSDFGIALLDRLKKNICDEDPRYPSLNLSTFSKASPLSKSSFDTIIDSLVTKPTPNDDHWMSLYNKSDGADFQNPTFDLLTANSDGSQNLELDYGLADIAPTSSVFASKDDFVDQAIYDMFS